MLCFWFTLEDHTCDVKLFSFVNKERIGFEVLLKG